MNKKQIKLTFNNEHSFNEAGKHVRDGLSSSVLTGRNLWTCCDERSSLERLTLMEDGSFGEHKTFDLNQYIKLPAGTDCEVDVEGLAVEDNKFLWIVGSHSLARKKPKKKHAPEKQIRRLTKIKDDPNRYILARIPLQKDVATSHYELCASCPDTHDPSKTIHAAQLINSEKGNQLMEVFAKDDHFKNFMNIPGKDNGFDIEGLAIHKKQIFIGMRGPVLRGWAMIVEIQIEDVSDGYFHLKPDNQGKLYKKHFLHLEGMGIRDLRVKEEGLLILAGPTMDLDGTIAVYHWNQGLKQQTEAIVHRQELKRLFDVPHGSGETTGQDKAEGMAILDNGHVLIVFDSPTLARKPDDASVLADLYPL
ncbi:DUF3616 domain-containing protein [Catalinimonas niigatensis]|uniref:DUF3616 domain-containing protein n=1 Tax=Catalinimonas niigatensis TaxID=1397264 RepID=UPI002665E33D|nr:DUF3616 domain-containing protein [Catalinimonas niigatensis]WPP50765.1 DUF3616 domain-containing protein [Catalinimonas niigatensis]